MSNAIYFDNIENIGIDFVHNIEHICIDPILSIILIYKYIYSVTLWLSNFE